MIADEISKLVTELGSEVKFMYNTYSISTAASRKAAVGMGLANDGALALREKIAAGMDFRGANRL